MADVSDYSAALGFRTGAGKPAVLLKWVPRVRVRF